jgi:hypothetical protein
MTFACEHFRRTTLGRTDGSHTRHPGGPETPGARVVKMNCAAVAVRSGRGVVFVADAGAFTGACLDLDLVTTADQVPNRLRNKPTRYSSALISLGTPIRRLSLDDWLGHRCRRRMPHQRKAAHAAAAVLHRRQEICSRDAGNGLWKQKRRLLQFAPQKLHEATSNGPVDDTVIVSERKRKHEPGYERPLELDHPARRAPHTQHADFG